jgi:hypothetical protein
MSGMEAMCAIAATGSTAIVAAAGGVSIGATRMLTTTKIESRPGNAIQNLIQALWCMQQRKKRSSAAHISAR